ncbi:MAG: ATP-binding protein, partial [Bacteroidales bacterium]|nr:ATP-binding protein [Bacteroidales bacterium]
IGPRQCGKSTLAKTIIKDISEVIYLDLERPSDLRKLEDAEWFFSTQKNSFFCIDEIQKKPGLFPLIRSLVDEWGENRKFLILGSASRDLLKQSSESLAGRISYLRLTPFLWKEIGKNFTIDDYLVQGGFPRSLLSISKDLSFKWREDFISTFLERDLLQWSGFSNETMRRLWQMLANFNGQTANYSLLANSLGVSSVTIRNYIDLLQGTFMLEVVPPYHSNAGKRMVKAPKIYVSDSGITNALLQIENFNQLSGNPVIGASWEQVVLSNLKGHFPSARFFFYRTSSGSEIDFVMNVKNKIYAIECKSSLSPGLSKGNYYAIDDIKPQQTFVVSPVERGWPVKKNIDIVSLEEIINRLTEAHKL